VSILNSAQEIGSGQKGSRIRVSSAGFRQGNCIGSLRRAFLLERGIPREEVDTQASGFWGRARTGRLDLVAELPMEARLLAAWPELQGRVMTVRGFVQGFSSQNEAISKADARIEDAGGHTAEENSRFTKNWKHWRSK